MLSAIVSALGGQIIDGVLGRVTGLFESYFKKQISLAELRAGMINALTASVTEVEKAHAESLSKTYESFQVTMRASPMIQRMWIIVVSSQLIVLVWHQVGIPAYVHFTASPYPSSGSTVEWAYALIGFLFGAGAMLFRTGPGANSGVVGQLKSLIGK